MKSQYVNMSDQYNRISGVAADYIENVFKRNADLFKVNQEYINQLSEIENRDRRGLILQVTSARLWNSIFIFNGKKNSFSSFMTAIHRHLSF